jgi:hypothetical protein
MFSTWARLDVAIDVAPVSPRGSPRRELTRRARVGLCAGVLLECASKPGSGSSGGNASMPDDLDAMMKAVSPDHNARSMLI